MEEQLGREILQQTRCLNNMHLLAAASRGDLEEVRRLAGNGAELTFADSAGNTAVHCAASSGNPALVEYLLDRGAALSAENARNETPLAIAVAAGDESQALLRRRVREAVLRAVGQPPWRDVLVEELESTLTTGGSGAYVVDGKSALVLDHPVVYYTQTAHARVKLKLLKLRSGGKFTVKKVVCDGDNPKKHIKHITDSLPMLRVLAVEEIVLGKLHLYPKLHRDDTTDTVFTYRDANKFCMLLEIHKDDDVFENARSRLYTPNGRLSPANLESLLRNGTAQAFLRHLRQSELAGVKECLNDSAPMERQPHPDLQLFHELLALVNSATDWEQAIFELNVNVVSLLREKDALRAQLLFAPRDRRLKNTLLEILSKYFKYYFARMVHRKLSQFLDSSEVSIAEMTNELNEFLAANDATCTYESYVPVNSTDVDIHEAVEFYLKYMAITDCGPSDVCKYELRKHFEMLNNVREDKARFREINGNFRQTLPPQLLPYYDEVIRLHVIEKRGLPHDLAKHINDFANELINLKPDKTIEPYYAYKIETKLGQLAFPCGGNANFRDVLLSMCTVFHYAVERKPMFYRDLGDTLDDPLFFKYLAEFADKAFLKTAVKRLIDTEMAAPFTLGMFLLVGNDDGIAINDSLKLMRHLLRGDRPGSCVQLLAIDFGEKDVHKKLLNSVQHFNVDHLKELLKDRRHVNSFWGALAAFDDAAIPTAAYRLIDTIAHHYFNQYEFDCVIQLLENEHVSTIQRKHFERDDPLVLWSHYLVANAKLKKAKTYLHINKSEHDNLEASARRSIKRILNNTSIAQNPTLYIASRCSLDSRRIGNGMELYYTVRNYAFDIDDVPIEGCDNELIKAEYPKIIRSVKYNALLTELSSHVKNYAKHVDPLYLLLTNAYYLLNYNKREALELVKTVYYLRKQNPNSRDTDRKMDMNKLGRFHEFIADDEQNPEIRMNHYCMALEYFLNIRELQKENNTNHDYTFDDFVYKTNKILQAIQGSI